MAPKKDPKTDLRRTEAKQLAAEYKTAAKDFGKELEKQIKKANLSGASQFKKDFQSAAAATNAAISEDFQNLQRAGLGDIAKEYTNAMQAVQNGIMSESDFRDVAQRFETAMEQSTYKVSKKLKIGMESQINNLELEGARENIESSVESGINGALDFIPQNAFTKALGIDAGVELIGKMFAEKIGPMAAKVGQSIAKNWKMALGAGLALFIAGALIKGIADSTDRIGESFGAIGVSEFKGELLGAQATAVRLGYDFEEVAGSVNELSNNFGVAFDESIKISESSMDTAKAIGISSDQAATLTGQLMTMSGHSAESAQNFLKQTAALAKSAGVAPAGVMEDIAGSSEAVASYTKDGGENIAQAAVKARSMGMALGDVAEIADGLLDFTGSLQKEMEASVLLGRNLNLEKARELALAGDLAGLQSEILEQVGSEAEWNAMNAVQRKAMADAIGTSVGNMSKMVTEAGKTTTELAKMRDLDISEIASKEAISSITLLTNNVKALGISILSGIAWISSFGGLLDGMGGTAQMVGAALGITISFLAGMWLFGKLASVGMGMLSKSLGPLGKSLAQLGAMGSVGIPVLVALGLVGLTIVGILYMIPPIIDSLAAGFKTVGETITNSLLVLAKSEIILGIMGLAAGFWMLASALGALAVAGIGALPVLAVVGGVAAIAGAAGMMGGMAGGTEESEEVQLLREVRDGINYLVKGFGGEATQTGKYIEEFAKKVPSKVKLGSGI